MSTPDPFGDALKAQAQSNAAGSDPYGAALAAHAAGTDIGSEASDETDSTEAAEARGLSQGPGFGGGYNPLNWPQMLADRSAEVALKGGNINPEAKNPANWKVAPSPTDATATHMLPLAIPAGQFIRGMAVPGAVRTAGMRGAAGSPGGLAPEITARAQSAADAAAQSGNAGAAGTAVDVSKLKPETQMAISNLHSQGKLPDPDALARIAKAESVGVDLTEGQAQQHTQKMANEFNRKGENGGLIGNRFDAQDDALTGELANTHRELAPTAVANSEIQNGQATINGIRRYDAPKVTQIDNAYKDARTLNNGNLELDASNFKSSVATGLKPQGKAKFLPPDVQGIVDEVSNMPNGRINLDDFEGYRTQLADAQREAAQAGRGNAVRAIKVVRDNFEGMSPTSDASTAAKAAFDKARKLNAARETEIEANPAYEAVVNDPKYNPRKPETMENPSDLADKFVGKYVIGGPQQGAVRLRTMLSGDQEANEAISSEALRPLRTAAKEGRGFAQDSYNNALRKLNARPELVNNPDSLEHLNTIGEVGLWTRLQRRGGTFNNSGSGSLLLQRAAEASGSLPGRVALGAIPYGTEAGKALQYMAEGSQARAAKEALQNAVKPGAGLER